MAGCLIKTANNGAPLKETIILCLLAHFDISSLKAIKQKKTNTVCWVFLFRSLAMTYFRYRALLGIATRRFAPQRRSNGTGVVTWTLVANSDVLDSKIKNPNSDAVGVFLFRSLAMTYSHMGKPHTTIGDEAFHV